MRREDIFMDILSDIDEKYVSLAMPDPRGHSGSAAASGASRRTPDIHSEVSRNELRRYMIVRTLGIAAAVALVAGGAILLWRNWDKIALSKEPDNTGESSVSAPVTSSASGGTVSGTADETVSGQMITDPIEYTYPKENVFVYENTLYEIDARAAFDYVIKTGDGYASIFENEYPEYDDLGYTDPVKDCLKDEYCVGELKIVEGMPYKGRETNFPKPSELYSFGSEDSPADNTVKYVVAQVSEEELDNIRKYFADSLAEPLEEIDTSTLRGVYYITAQTTIMPKGYYGHFSHDEAVEMSRSAFQAEGMSGEFRTGQNYMSFPMPVYAAPYLDYVDEHGRRGEVIFYLGGGNGVYAAITDNKIDDSWILEPISEAFKKGEKVMFVTDGANTAMLTSTGGKYIVRGDRMPEAVLFFDEEAFPIRKCIVMNPPSINYELTETDLEEIYSKAYSAWITDGDENRSLGYPIKVEYQNSTGRGTWFIPVFDGDTVIGVITAFYLTDEWYAGQYSPEAAEILTELYESGEPFNLTAFGSGLYVCTKDKKSIPYESSLYDKPRNVYLFDESKAAPLHKWKDDGKQTDYKSPAAILKVREEYLNDDKMTAGTLPASYFANIISVEGEGYGNICDQPVEQFTDMMNVLQYHPELQEALAPYFDEHKFEYEKMREEKPQVEVYGLFDDTPKTIGGDYGVYRLSDDYIISISDSLQVRIYVKTNQYTQFRKGIELLWKKYDNTDGVTVVAVTEYGVMGNSRIEIVAPERVLNGIKWLFTENGLEISRFVFLTPDQKRSQWVPADIFGLSEAQVRRYDNEKVYVQEGVYLIDDMQEALIAAGESAAVDKMNEGHGAGVLTAGELLTMYTDLLDNITFLTGDSAVSISDDIVVEQIVGDNGTVDHFRIMRYDKELTEAVTAAAFFRVTPYRVTGDDKSFRIKRISLHAYDDGRGYSVTLTVNEDEADALREFIAGQGIPVKTEIITE